jgi:hypothetical protein
VAPQLGVSLYTWTSVIGVILAGMSLGNYLGGRMADRWASPPFLGLIYALGSVTTWPSCGSSTSTRARVLQQAAADGVGGGLHRGGVLFAEHGVGCVSPIVVNSRCST